jgi:hypothetical protein
MAIGQKTGTLYRITATLAEDRSVSFGTTPSTLKELSKIFDEITAHVGDFQKFSSEINSELQSLREKVPL